MPRALPRRSRSRLAVAVALAAAMLLVLALAPVASADLLSPESGGSPNADSIDTLYWIVFALALIVWIGVEGALIYSIFKFRARRGAVAAQIRGNTRLEIGWTVGAAVILVVLAVVTFIKLPSIRNPPNSDANGLSAQSGVLYASTERPTPPNGKALTICVNGQQYVWRYTYGTACKNQPLNAVFSYRELYVPTGTTVLLDIVAQDVIHSWWIPKLGGKMQAVPGYTNHTWFKIPTAGNYFGQCAELCGRNHANMVAVVIAMSPDKWRTWFNGKKAQLKAADKAAAVSRKRLEANSQANP
jgi:cytochrome c oxidase subunit 2